MSAIIQPITRTNCVVSTIIRIYSNRHEVASTYIMVIRCISVANVFQLYGVYEVYII